MFVLSLQRPYILLLGLLFVPLAAWAQAPTITVTTQGNYTSFPANSDITLIATVNSSNVPAVSFYNGRQFLGVGTLVSNANNQSVFNFVWHNVPTGSYSISAAIGYGSPSGGTSTSNGPIDLVGSSSFPYQGALFNPSQDPNFGEGGSGSWLEGDNQMCINPGSGGICANGTLCSPLGSACADQSTCTWPGYNASKATFPNGTCAWTNSATPPTSTTPGANSTVDSLDDVMHALTDFAAFSKTLLNHDVASLSASFNSWYPQAALWIAPGGGTTSCGDGSSCDANTGLCADGSACLIPAGRLISLPASINAWSGVINNWLNVVYTPSNSTSHNLWCVPSESVASGLMAVNNAGQTVYTTEDQYIHNNGGGGPWGDLPHVIACLNYNASQVPDFTPNTSNYTETPIQGAAENYKQCLSDITSHCPASLPSSCDPGLLGRSMTPAFTGTYSGQPSDCDTTASNSYAQWVQTNYTLFTDAKPKFALRAAFLTDLYMRATAFQSITSNAGAAIQNFIDGPGALLTAAYNCANGATGASSDFATAVSKVAQSVDPQFNGSCTQGMTIPNSVIYGWVDKVPLGQTGSCQGTDAATGKPMRVGCAHLVKVTVYSAGRNVNKSDGQSYVADSLLPWVQTKTSGILNTTRTFTLQDRDETVYVGIKRWDEDHASVLFPNGRPLWQFLFHNPAQGGQPQTGEGLIEACNDVQLSNGQAVGFGLSQQTVAGLNYMIAKGQLLPQDVKSDNSGSLQNAFMLNDEADGSGNIDPQAKNNGNYATCLSEANALLLNAPESHACVKYVASRDPGDVARGQSGIGGMDYSLEFVPCPVKAGTGSQNGYQPEDLKTGGSELNHG